MAEERLLHENAKLRADLAEYVQKSDFWYEQWEGLRERIVRLEAALERISTPDWVDGGKCVRGNEELPDPETRRFYQGYNSGIESQFERSRSIARAALDTAEEASNAKTTP